MNKKNFTKNNHLLAVFLSTSFLVISIFIYYHQTSSPTVLGTTNNTTSTSDAKEFFVPLGYGNVNSASDWADVQGMQVSVNSSQYPRVKQALFEVTAYSPNGNQTIWLRLRNNDYYSYPTVTMVGTGPNLLTSSPFSISPGPKTYYVQLKTQLGYPVQIYQARLHIITY